MKQPKQTNRKVVKFAACVALVCITFAYGQKVNTERNPDYKTVVITPKIQEVGLPQGGLSLQSFSSSINGDVIYVPRNSTGNSVRLFFDQKSGETIRRTSYDFNKYFMDKRRPTDVDDSPDVIADPHRSANGSHVIFKHLLSGDNYQIYSLDLVSNEISRVEKDLISYEHVSISPNGKYIAFLEGGDAVGHVYKSDIDKDYYAGPMKLFVVDAQGKEKQLVAQGNYLNGALEWDSNELYYGGEEGKVVGAPGKVNVPKLNIYRYNAESKKSTLLIENGIMPHPSRSGARVVFFGPASKETAVDWSQDWQSKPIAGISLLSASQDGSGRIALEPAGRSYPDICWLSDDTQIFSLREATYSPIATAQVRLWNVETQDTRVITELKVKNSPEALKSSVYPTFDLVKGDSASVLISTSEYLGFNTKEANINMKNALYSVDVTDGKTNLRLSAINTLMLGYDVYFQ